MVWRGMQVVEQEYDEEAAKAMMLKKGTVCIMIHTGSRGLGHQVCPVHGLAPHPTAIHGTVFNSFVLHCLTPMKLARTCC